MNVIRAIKTKRSVREYAGQEVPVELIVQIVDTGWRAQSSRNSQPWTFTVVRQGQRLQELAACGDYAQPLALAALGVSLLIKIYTTKGTKEHKGKPEPLTLEVCLSKSGSPRFAV